jgi:two-component system sensor histidine kinase EvgS
MGDTPRFLHMAVPKDRKILRDIMDKALGSISEKEKRTVINRYVPRSLSPAEGKPAATTIDLTAAERKWLEDHPVLRVAPDPDDPPLEFFDKQGRYQGLAGRALTPKPIPGYQGGYGGKHAGRRYQSRLQRV